ncbi:MAG: helix-turn-helix transcriptional regulator [Thermodesulfobacteriota bacterium]|nr:helix-turn-helix transcriptional regulator [Thermodesulfobacteriota bacterium]
MENRTINIKSTQYPILKTKLYVPQPRPDLVQRTHLIDRLNKGINHKLTLISAPAGFGKTTLLSEWISQSEIPVAWISLDKGDNDPVHFIHYLIATLQTIESNIGKPVLSLLKSPRQPPIKSMMINLIKEISDIHDDFMFVLDDYHSIDAEKIHKIVEFLIDHSPPHIHLVISTRVDPPLPLARLRVRNQLSEFRTSDLCFTFKETSLFFNKMMNLALSSHEISMLESRTEGWIAGLQLAALSMQGRGNIPEFIETFAGDDHHIVDYLAEEVLNHQSEQIQNFLLQTSILSRLSGPLCDFVTDRKGGQEMLVDLERANLFILPLDNKRRWYRYHHLFADLLRQRLHRTHGDRMHELHKRASEWYEQNAFGEEAIEHALMAQDFKRAARLVEELTEAIWQRGEPTLLFRWIEALPDAYVISRPNLCISYAWILSESGQQQAAERSLQTAEKIIDSTNNGKIIKPKGQSTRQQSLTSRELQGRIAAIRAYMATDRGDVQSSLKFSERALKCLHKEDSTWRAGVALSSGIANSLRGDNVSANKALSEAVEASKAADNINLYLAANFWLVVSLKYNGQLPRAIEICKHLLKIVNEEKLAYTAIEGALFGVWGEILYELNELDEALHYVRKGLILMEHGHHVGGRSWAYYGLLKILAAKNDLPGVEESIQKIARLEQASEVPLWVTHPIEAWKARIWLMNGNIDRAVKWAKERELTLNDDLTPMRETEHIMLARILIAQGRLNDAIRLLDRLSKVSEKGGRVLNQIEALLVKALALRAQRNITEASVALGKVVSLAEPGGYIRIFLDEGPPIAKLLEKILDTKLDVPRAYVKKLLSAFRLSKLVPERKVMVLRASRLVMFVH